MNLGEPEDRPKYSAIKMYKPKHTATTIYQLPPVSSHSIISQPVRASDNPAYYSFHQKIKSEPVAYCELVDMGEISLNDKIAEDSRAAMETDNKQSQVLYEDILCPLELIFSLVVAVVAAFDDCAAYTADDAAAPYIVVNTISIVGV